MKVAVRRQPGIDVILSEPFDSAQGRLRERRIPPEPGRGLDHRRPGEILRPLRGLRMTTIVEETL
jgi:hypothetical protein